MVELLLAKMKEVFNTSCQACLFLNLNTLGGRVND